MSDSQQKRHFSQLIQVRLTKEVHVVQNSQDVYGSSEKTTGAAGSAVASENSGGLARRNDHASLTYREDARVVRPQFRSVVDLEPRSVRQVLQQVHVSPMNLPTTMLHFFLLLCSVLTCGKDGWIGGCWFFFLFCLVDLVCLLVGLIVLCLFACLFFAVCSSKITYKQLTHPGHE